VGFALLEITPRRLSITFYDGTGAMRAGPYLMNK
jgi:hypothetical protein